MIVTRLSTAVIRELSIRVLPGCTISAELKVARTFPLSRATSEIFTRR
jgi:hypothetical protein